MNNAFTISPRQPSDHANTTLNQNYLKAPSPNYGISFLSQKTIYVPAQSEPATASACNILTDPDDVAATSENAEVAEVATTLGNGQVVTSFGTNASPDFVLGTRPKDITSMTSDELALWKLRNVFNHIYVTTQRVMRLWIDPCWRPIIDACFWSTIESSGGDPRVSNVSHRNNVQIGDAYNAITLKFGEPNVLYVTCAQWYKYVALTNALSRIQVTVREYEYMREHMLRPGDYICVQMAELFPSIDRDRYFVNQIACFDYESTKNPEATYPWPA